MLSVRQTDTAQTSEKSEATLITSSYASTRGTLIGLERWNQMTQQFRVSRSREEVTLGHSSRHWLD